MAGSTCCFRQRSSLPTRGSFSVSWMEPVSPDVTVLRARVWAAKSWMNMRGSVKDLPGYDKATGMIKSSHWNKHPLSTGDFQDRGRLCCRENATRPAQPEIRRQRAGTGCRRRSAPDLLPGNRAQIRFRLKKPRLSRRIARHFRRWRHARRHLLAFACLSTERRALQPFQDRQIIPSLSRTHGDGAILRFQAEFS